MNTATLHISRKIADQKEDKGDMQFIEGDYFNIYHAMIVSEKLGENNEMIKKFTAFKIDSISDNSVNIKLIYPAPPTKDFSLKIGDSKEVEFGEYGIYTITLSEVL